MELLEAMWSFVCQNSDEAFLDCEIITSNKKFLTNKCFLSLSRKFLRGLSLPDDEKLTIFMTEFSTREIKEELCGFVNIIGETSDSECSMNMNTDCEKDIEWKLPGLQTSEQNPRKESYQCDVCGKVFVKAKPLWNHKFQVHNKDYHQCKQCLKLFKTKAILIKHIRQVHDEIKYRCLCSKEFTQKVSLLRHSKKCKSLLKF